MSKSTKDAQSKSPKTDSDDRERFRSAHTQQRITEHLREVNGPLTIREIAEALDIEPAVIAGNLGELQSKAEQGKEGVRRVMGKGDITRYEIALAK